MLAYLAGFFDGEGCVQLVKPSPKLPQTVTGINLTVSVGNTSTEPLELIKRHFGSGVYDSPLTGKLGVRPTWVWRASGRRAAYFLSNIEPFLIIKAEQVKCALMFAETYFDEWHTKSRHFRPLTAEAIRLRTAAFKAFRVAMNSRTGRGITWSLPRAS